LTTSYTISIAASNALGLGLAASAEYVPAMVSKPDQGWDDLAMFAQSAQPGSPASFVLPPGVVNVSYWIRLAGDIDMTIRGAAEGGTVLDARKTTRFFVVGEGATLRLHGPLTLTNGRAYDSPGGALYIYAGAKVFARGVVFTKNDVEYSGTRDGFVIHGGALSGGAILMWGERQTRLELNACNFTSNVLSEGGYKLAAAVAVMSGCSLYSCETAEPVVVITDSHFERNRSPTIAVRRTTHTPRHTPHCISALYLLTELLLTEQGAIFIYDAVGADEDHPDFSLYPRCPYHIQLQTSTFVGNAAATGVTCPNTNTHALHLLSSSFSVVSTGALSL
jgi:hypothetical protein